MQITDRLTSPHFYTQTDSGLVQFGNAVGFVSQSFVGQC